MASNAVKKGYELDSRVQKIIDEEFTDFEKYLKSPQDRKMYERKRKEYWDKITARLKEEVAVNGRADAGTAVSATAGE